ncbi:MAG: hypothetical protein N2234_05475 [Planctomycetota bacterium]|nr:hypothetical protein [Planctomycetota bacterium]
MSGKNLVEEDYRISPYEGAVECLVLGLRTSEGVAEKHLIERTGFSVSDFSDSIEHLKSEGFITQQEGRIVPTEKGFLYHNTLSSLIE